MSDKIKVRRNAGSPREVDALETIDELTATVGMRTVYHPETALTLSDIHQGLLLVLTSGCTVTIPSALRDGFSCGWCQMGADAVTFAAGDGTSIRSLGDAVASAGQYSVGGIGRLPDGDYLLYGSIE